MEQEFIILKDYMTFTSGLNVVRVSRSLVVFVVFCRSPFVLFFFLCWLLHCLSVFPLFSFPIDHGVVCPSLIVSLRYIKPFLVWVHVIVDIPKKKVNTKIERYLKSCTDKHEYKGHRKWPENMPFIWICP